MTLLTMRWLLAALHLLGFGVGLGAIWARGAALRGPLDAGGLRRVLYADAWWGVAALIWIVTGLVRAFAPVEKGADYYLHNHLFLAKMGLFALIFALEIAPMVTFIQWRRALAAGRTPETGSAPRLARVSLLQALVLLLMLAAATGLARGFGTPVGSTERL